MIQTVTIERKEPVMNEESSGEGEPETGRKQCRYTLLVVEDSLEMRLFVTKQLSSEYQVLTAVNGIEAVECVGRTYGQSWLFLYYEPGDGWIGTE